MTRGPRCTLVRLQVLGKETKDLEFQNKADSHHPQATFYYLQQLHCSKGGAHQLETDQHQTPLFKSINVPVLQSIKKH